MKTSINASKPSALRFRAPTNVMTQDRRPEGRIYRIPPRPRSGRYVWVPGPFLAI